MLNAPDSPAGQVPERSADSTAATAPSLEVRARLLAHELRTPLTSVVGYLQLLEDEEMLTDTAILRSLLHTVRTQALQMARIVSELAAFGEAPQLAGLAGSGGAPTLEAVVEALAGGRRVQLEGSAEALHAIIEPDPLRLAMNALLDNAVRFGTPGTDVHVRASLEGHPLSLVARVSNIGDPIPEHLHETIFAPFRQAEESGGRQHGGLGLGLTVARRSAESAGGALTLEPGLPTTFRLQLPLRDDPVAQEARALRERSALADAQVLRAITDVRALRGERDRSELALTRAEAQQIRVAEDFRTLYRETRVLAERLDGAYLNTVMALARVVDLRDASTGRHADRVRVCSVRIGQVLSLDAVTLRHLEHGAALHDIGKIGVADTILHKPGELTSDEAAQMREHPTIGLQLLEGVTALSLALPAVAHHHERWDGSGYPHGLRAEAVPVIGRIVAVADAYDEMMSDHPHRRGLAPQAARSVIARGRGTQFDPAITDAFLLVTAPS